MKAKKLPSGNWRVQVYVGKDKNGKRILKSFTAESRKEAELLAMDFKLNQSQNVSDLTVGEAIERYIDNRTAVISPTTLKGYRVLQKNAYDTINHMPVKNASSDAIQSYINEYAVNPFA